ncbi:MAG: hypothetical protein KJZ95_02150 [Caldilinea sp.]|nr:hypothetical protein [Caldilinea sp.]
MRFFALLVVFLLLSFALLGFSLAKSDAFNPITATSNAVIAGKQFALTEERQQSELRLMEMRAAAEIEAFRNRSRTVQFVIYMLSAVLASCAIAITVAIVVWLMGTSRRANDVTMSSPTFRPSMLHPEEKTNGSKSASRRRVL